MRRRLLAIGAVLTIGLSCAPGKHESSDPHDILRRIESSLLRTPGLAVILPPEPSRVSFTLLTHGKEYRESSSGRFVVKQGIVYRVYEAGPNDFDETPVGHRPGAPPRVPNSKDKPAGEILIDVLQAWGLVDPFVRELQDDHLMTTELLTAFLAEARLGHDREGSFLICRFRVEGLAYFLPKKYWNQTIIGGVEFDPPLPMTGTAEHKLRYDPVTFTPTKRTITGEYALDGGRVRTLQPINEAFKPRWGGERR
jgi:hypothetical protein